MKYKILLVMGPAGAGKDTFVEYLIKSKPSLFKKVITCTTRPPRNNEEQDINYHFLTEKEFKEKEMFESVIFNNWYYGTSYEDLHNDYVNVIIATPNCLNTYLNNNNFEIVEIVYLKTPDTLRIERQLIREPEPNCSEICRRFLTDKEDFKDIEQKLLDTSVNFSEVPNRNMYDLSVNIIDIGRMVQSLVDQDEIS